VTVLRRIKQIIESSNACDGAPTHETSLKSERYIEFFVKAGRLDNFNYVKWAGRARGSYIQAQTWRCGKAFTKL
jgi:hypothetical protein